MEDQITTPQEQPLGTVINAYERFNAAMDDFKKELAHACSCLFEALEREESQTDADER